MNEQPGSTHSLTSDIPYYPENPADVESFWMNAIPHTGIAEIRAEHQHSGKTANQGKEQISLRVDADLLAWYRASGAGWQTRMHAVLKAHADANKVVRL